MIEYFILKPLMEGGDKKRKMLGTIQAVLQTLNAKSQNTKISNVKHQFMAPFWRP